MSKTKTADAAPAPEAPPPSPPPAEPTGSPVATAPPPSASPPAPSAAEAKLQPLLDRLRAVYARKLAATKFGNSGSRLECWMTRSGKSYLIQIWDDGAWKVWAALTDNDATDPNALAVIA